MFSNYKCDPIHSEIAGVGRCDWLRVKVTSYTKFTTGHRHIHSNSSDKQGFTLYQESGGGDEP